MLCKTIECASMSLITHKGGGFALFHLYWVVSGWFQVVTCCSGSFQLVLACYTWSIYYKQQLLHNVLTCNFTKYRLLFKFDYEVGHVLLQIRAALLYYIVRASGITKYGRYYRAGLFLVEQLLHSFAIIAK